MKLSIVIAYYNAEIYIEELLTSLLDQGFERDEVEIIVVDDESTQSVEVLMDFCRCHPNCQYVWQKNARQSAARNRGISIARGEYIFICDNDDCVNRQVFSRICQIAHSNDLDMLFFNRIIIDENERPSTVKMDFNSLESIRTGQEYISIHPNTSTGPWHYIIKRSFINECSLTFPEGKILCEDVDFLIDALVKARRVSYLNVDVYYWIQRKTSISHQNGTEEWTERLIENMFWHINKRKRMIVDNSELDVSFVNWLSSNIHSHSYRIMRNAFLFLPYRRNKEIIKQLKRINEYPLKRDLTSKGKIYNSLIPLMNMEKTWLLLCFMYNHIVPLPLRRLVQKRV